MKTLLLTAFDDKMRELGELTTPIMLVYAQKHGMDFRCVKENSPKNGWRPSTWHKIFNILSAFKQGYDRVIWLDADIIITNPEFVPPWQSGFHASQDWGSDAIELSHFSTGSFLVCHNAQILFDYVLSHANDDPMQEQNLLRGLYKNNKNIMTIHPRRVFNAVPAEIDKNVQEPWQAGDWLCHLTMIPIKEKMKLFNKINRPGKKIASKITIL